LGFKPTTGIQFADLGAVDERGAVPAKITVKLVQKR
jgi:hypothetical protein